MKQNAYFLDLRNKEQVEWFNKIGRKLAIAAIRGIIADTATNKPVGYVIRPKGPFKNYVIKKANSFMKECTTMIINENEKVH